jgi:IS30 family transposase
VQEETLAERHQREINEIADALLRKYYPPGTTLAEVWAEALSIHRLQFALDSLEPLPLKERE